jgi:RNA polymerase sigma factor (TIGR02999 family)
MTRFLRMKTPSKRNAESVPIPSHSVTALLAAWTNGDEAAAAPLIDAVYGELRQLARAHLRKERRDHSLPATALVHEAYLKLVDQRQVKWQNRAHFFAIAARVMRRLLVDHGRSRGAQKRGQALTVPLPDVHPTVDPPEPDVLALDRALEKLSALDPRQGQLVELRFFGGLTVEEAAEVLDIAPITVKRDWALARTWLYRELRREGA